MDYLSPDIHRDIFGWHSPRLGLDMPIARYGGWGKALLLFPTAAADYLEHERFYLIKSLEPLIRQGRLTVFSIGSINRMAWMDRGLPVQEQARRQALFSGYVEQEVVPHIRTALQDPGARMMVAGASFGAFHAANAFFRRPDVFDTLIGMSGMYDLGPGYLQGFMNDEAYFNNPPSYVPNIHDGSQLELISRGQIHILTGQGQWEHPEMSQRFSDVLWSKGIWNNLDLWGHDMPHDWPTWRQMLPYYLGNRVGI
jgi:esterase/lipase superfamily enzyme